jgi:hypothetical protein
MKLAVFVMSFLLLVLSVMAISTKPLVSVSSSVDLALNQSLMFNFTLGIARNETPNETIINTFFENNISLFDLNSTSLALSRLIGNYSYYVCARSEMNETNCSDTVNVVVFYGGKPIIGSFPEMTGTPTYSDNTIARRVFGIIITDPNSIWVNASLWPTEDDYYGDDSTNISVISCAERQIIGNDHYFNCTVPVYRNLQPGSYNIKMSAGNQYNSVEKVFSRKLTINNLLSANITYPEIDLNDYYNGWAQSSSPIIITNNGNTAFSEIGVQTEDIQCNGKSIPVEDIFLNYRLSKSSAVVCNPMTWFSRKIYRGSSQDIYLFVRNNDTVSNCRFVWDLIIGWRE